MNNDFSPGTIFLAGQIARADHIKLITGDVENDILVANVRNKLA